MQISKTISRVVLLLVALSALLLACVPEPEGAAFDATPTPDLDLIDTTWYLIQYGPAEEPISVAHTGDRQASLSFTADSISGSTGCNSYTGSYTIDGNNIEVAEVIQTEMACLEPEGIMAQEAAFTSALNQAETLRQEGDRLIMSYPDGELVFAQQPPAAAEQPAAESALAGTDWFVDLISEDDMAFAPVEGTQMTLLFDEGRLGGSTGCNSFGADYSIDGDNLTVGIIEQTMMACSDELMVQENRYLQALAASRSYVLEDGNLLNISTETGSIVLRPLTESPPADVEQPEMQINEAPVQEITLNLMESFPLQASITAQLQLPDGCTSYSHVEQQTEGNVINLTLYTQRPRDMMCTQQIVEATETVPLDIAGLAAGTYTVNVNGLTTELTLDVDN